MIGGLTPEQQVAILEQFEEPLRRQIQELLLKFEDLFALEGKEFDEVFTKGFTPPELGHLRISEQQNMVWPTLETKPPRHLKRLWRIPVGSGQSKRRS